MNIDIPCLLSYYVNTATTQQLTGTNVMNAIHDEQFIVSALSQGKLHLKAYLASIEAERYAENLRAEVKYDMEPRYEQVIVINVRTGAITGDGFMVFDERAARRALDLVLVEMSIA